jgi:hypothetical protein
MTMERRWSFPTRSSCQGLALASTSFFAADKLVDPKAKPWGDERITGVTERARKDGASC